MPHLYKIENITLRPRQRSTPVEEAGIDDLAESIAENGLINPICVLRTELGKGQLIAGWRRLHAMMKLHATKTPFMHESQPVLEGCVPVTVVSSADLPQLLKLELVENKDRLNLSWQDEAAAVAAIDEARRQADSAYTQKSLAVELVEKLGGTVAAKQVKITQALQVAKALIQRPELSKAKSAEDVYKLLRRERHEALEAELHKRNLRVDSDKPLAEVQPWTMHHGDLRELLPTLESGTVSLVFCDPPYGIDIDKQRYAATQMHRYDDSAAAAIDLATIIIQESWRLTKPQANFFMFCDWEHFATLQSAARRYGWETWMRPIIWNKSLTEGAAPWRKHGFLNTYECLLWATKGQLGIKGPLPDVLYAQKVGVVNRDHAAEKPVELLMQLIMASTEVGDLVLDPCAGSGSTLDAALRTKRSALGIELDEVYYNRSLTKLSTLVEAISKNPSLVQTHPKFTSNLVAAE